MRTVLILPDRRWRRPLRWRIRQPLAQPPWPGKLCTYTQTHPVPMPESHCTSSRVDKVMLSCWIPEGLRQELDRAGAEQGLRPHGRTQNHGKPA